MKNYLVLFLFFVSCVKENNNCETEVLFVSVSEISSEVKTDIAVRYPSSSITNTEKVIECDNSFVYRISIRLEKVEKVLVYSSFGDFLGEEI